MDIDNTEENDRNHALFLLEQPFLKPPRAPIRMTGADALTDTNISQNNLVTLENPGLKALSSLLKRHTKLHIGERPHICPKCDRKFARGDMHARHIGNKQGGCSGRRANIDSLGSDDDYDPKHTSDNGDEGPPSGSYSPSSDCMGSSSAGTSSGGDRHIPNTSVPRTKYGQFVRLSGIRPHQLGHTHIMESGVKANGSSGYKAPSLSQEWNDDTFGSPGAGNIKYQELENFIQSEASPSLAQPEWPLESRSESGPTSEVDSESDSELEVNETNHTDFICLRTILQDELQQLQDGETEQNISLLKDQLLYYILKEYWTSVELNEASSPITCTGTPPTSDGSSSHNPDPVENPALSCTQGGKRKYQSDNFQGKDKSLPKRVKNAGSRGKTKKVTSQSFACPFRKHNANEYGIINWPYCSLSSYPTISRLKEHLIRGPHRLWECDRCRTSFDTEQHRIDHNREVIPCQLLTGTYAEGEGIHPHHVEWLRAKGKSYTQAVGKSYSQQSEEERWITIFQKLFSYPDEMIPSPYFEEPIVERTSPLNSRDRDEFQRYFQEELLRDFRQQAASEFSEDAINGVSAIFEDCMPRILMRFNQDPTSRSISSQGSNDGVESGIQRRESSASSNRNSRPSLTSSDRHGFSTETDPTEYSPPQALVMQLSDQSLQQQSEAVVQDGLSFDRESEDPYNGIGTGVDENFGFGIDGDFDFSITDLGNDVQFGAWGCDSKQPESSGKSKCS